MRPLLHIAFLWLLAFTPVQAQFDLQVIPELSPITSGPPDHDTTVEARVRTAPGAAVGLLEVRVSMESSWHIYSMTQKRPPIKAEIQLEPGDYRLLGSFSPDRPAKVHFEKIFEIEVEEYDGHVTWSVPLAWTAGEPVEVRGRLVGQVCSTAGTCAGVEQAFSAAIDPTTPLTTQEVTALAGADVRRSHTSIRGWLHSATVRPGEVALLHLAMSPQDRWHVYAHADVPPEFRYPTLVHLDQPAGWKRESGRSTSTVISEEIIPGEPPTQYYDGPVTVSVPLLIPEDASGTVLLTGHVALQTCSDAQCDPPTSVAWSAEVRIADSADAGDGPPGLIPVTFTAAKLDYDAVADLLRAEHPEQLAGDGSNTGDTDGPAVSDIDGLEVQNRDNTEYSLARILVLAFVGGFILNFMPCVLPVIGLKIMSFAEQAGASRVRAFWLNAWYALGMLSVFWVLAVLAAAPAFGVGEQGLGWGQQFNYQGFAIPLVCLVFVMGLSFLGVWEIPIPGFATGSQANALAEQEGYSGAFCKGVITTILATPCSAPGLGTAFGWSIQSGSAVLAFLVFTVLGLGMAIPYLIIGAFPSLIRFLPKPGAWMDTFKQLMGFVLLGTVIFLMQNVVWQLLLPTVTMLFGLWLACWWIGRVPMTAPRSKRLRAWAIAGAIAIVVATISFGRGVDAYGRHFRGVRGWAEQKFNLEVDRLLGERAAGTAVRDEPASENELPWEPFSLALLDELRSSQTTVLVDFTADW